MKDELWIDRGFKRPKNSRGSHMLNRMPKSFKKRRWYHDDTKVFHVIVITGSTACFIIIALICVGIL